MKVTGQYFHTYGTVSFSTRLHIILRFLFRIVSFFLNIEQPCFVALWFIDTSLYCERYIVIYISNLQ